MPFACAIAECKSSKREKQLRGSELMFHRFPKKPETIKLWLVKCRRADTVNIKNATVCSEHFIESDYVRDLKNELLGLPTKKRLNPDAVPSIFSFRDTPSQQSSARSNRIIKGRARKIVADLLSQKKDNSDNGAGCFQADKLVSGQNNSSMEHIIEGSSKNPDIMHGEIQALQKVRDLHQEEILRLNNVVRDLKQKYKNAQKSCILNSANVSNNKKQWKTNEIISAFSIRSVSLKAYNNARKISNINLPCVSTLNKWAQRFSCEEGFLEDVLLAIRDRAASMDNFSKLCVLMFDEMSIDATHVIDPGLKKISSFSKAQVIMIRGICANWKQPIYYDFNVNITKKLLLEAISRVEQTGLLVMAVVCDLGNENRCLLKNMNISDTNIFVPNPVDSSRNIYFLPDIPHCLKNIRNHLLDDGVLLPEGVVLDKQILYKMLAFNGEELKLCPNFTKAKLELNGAERMRVRPAAQLMSHRVATLAYRCFPDQPAFGNFFKTINNGFDVLNSRYPRDKSNPLKSGYGFNISSQEKALQEFINMLRVMKFKTKKGNLKRVYLPCQSGFLISALSLQGLYKELKEKFGVSYVLSSRLNQDGLENFFSRIRALGKSNSHPTASEFRYRMRLVILGTQLRTINGSNVDNWENNNSYLVKALLQNKTDCSRDDEKGKKIREEIEKHLHLTA